MVVVVVVVQVPAPVLAVVIVVAVVEVVVVAAGAGAGAVAGAVAALLLLLSLLLWRFCCICSSSRWGEGRWVRYVEAISISLQQLHGHLGNMRQSTGLHALLRALDEQGAEQQHRQVAPTLGIQSRWLRSSKSQNTQPLKQTASRPWAPN